MTEYNRNDGEASGYGVLQIFSGILAIVATTSGVTRFNLWVMSNTNGLASSAVLMAEGVLCGAAAYYFAKKHEKVTTESGE